MECASTGNSDRNASRSIIPQSLCTVLRMIVATSMNEKLFSNAYVIGDEPGGHGVVIDSGAPPEPLLEAIEESDLTITHLLLTHHHFDHVEFNHVYKEKFGVEILAHPIEAAELMDVDRTIEPGEPGGSGGPH